MNARLGKIEKSEAYIEFEIDADTLEDGMEKAYRKVVKKVTVPGFRKGRVPRPLLEAHFGREILYEDALEIVVPDAYEQAVKELEIEPINQPEFEKIGDIEKGQPLNIKVKVAVKPEVKLGKVEGIEVTVPCMEVTEADVDARLESMRSNYAPLVEKVDEAAADGDTVNINFVGSVAGEAFNGGTANNYSLQLGSKTFIPGFEEQLIGAKTGDQLDVKVTFPESYHEKDLAGKDAVFNTTINKIETKQLSELNDAFAQEISEFETMAELRENVKNNLVKTAENKKKQMIEDEVVSAALADSEMTVPDSVIDNQVTAMFKQFEKRLGAQGFKVDQYCQMANLSEENIRQDMWPEAERSIKTNFVLEKLIEEKGIEVSDEEANKKLEEIAGKSSDDDEKKLIKKRFEMMWDDFISNLKMEKAVKYLIDNAEITENDPGEKTEENKGIEEKPESNESITEGESSTQKE